MTEQEIKALQDELAAAHDRIRALGVTYEKAERALLRAGFEDHGGQEWKPPLGDNKAAFADKEMGK